MSNDWVCKVFAISDIVFVQTVFNVDFMGRESVSSLCMTSYSQLVCSMVVKGEST